MITAIVSYLVKHIRAFGGSVISMFARFMRNIQKGLVGADLVGKIEAGDSRR